MFKASILAAALLLSSIPPAAASWSYACYDGNYKYVGIFPVRQAGLNCILL